VMPSGHRVNERWQEVCANERLAKLKNGRKARDGNGFIGSGSCPRSLADPGEAM
jgi:hypothetical protein